MLNMDWNISTHNPYWNLKEQDLVVTLDTKLTVRKRRNVMRNVIRVMGKTDMAITSNKEEVLQCFWIIKLCTKTKEIKQNSVQHWNFCKIVCKLYGNAQRKFCKLYLKEKLLIIKFPNEDILLNERFEFIDKFRHENKKIINNLK